MQAPAASEDLETASIVERHKEAVVSIENPYGRCAGVMVGSRGLILAPHAKLTDPGINQVVLTTSSGRKERKEARLAAIDYERNLSLLEVEAEGPLPVVSLESPQEEAAAGDGLVLVGHADDGSGLAVKSGIDKDIALEVMLNSAITSPAMRYRGPFAVELPENPLFNVTGQRKDINMALEMGDDLNIPLNTAAATAQIMAICSAMGYEDEDFGVMYKVLEQLSGMEDSVK